MGDVQSFETLSDSDLANSSSSSSWSVLSGCESIASLNSSSSMASRGLSYCEAAKLGSSRRAAKTTKRYVNSFSRTISRKEAATTQAQQDQNSMDTDDDDIVMFLYDGAKSCHGGKQSEKFRGSQRTIHHHRPNWTRKQRKAKKLAWTWEPSKNSP